MSADAVRPFTAASFNKYLAENKLMAVRCVDCGLLQAPPRAICPQCYGAALEWVALSGRGTLAAYTAINIGLTSLGAEGYGRDNPYCSAIVELAEGVKISARLLGVDGRKPAEIHIGAPLTVAFIERPGGGTVLAFRPHEN